MSTSAPQTDGSQNQPTNTQAQPGSQMQQQFIQIGKPMKHELVSAINALFQAIVHTFTFNQLSAADTHRVHTRHSDLGCLCTHECFLPVSFLATALQNHATLTAKSTARALLQYCSSGDVRPLLNLQRHLCGVQDENGDT